jgi:hypothetical protein
MNELRAPDEGDVGLGPASRLALSITFRPIISGPALNSLAAFLYLHSAYALLGIKPPHTLFFHLVASLPMV